MSDSVSFYNAPETLTAAELARIGGCVLREGDDPSIVITGIAPIEAATAGSVTFINNPKYLKAVEETKAAALICSKAHAAKVSAEIAVLIAADPYRAFAQIAAAMYPDGLRPSILTGEKGVSDKAFVHQSAKLEADVIVEAGAVIGEGAAIGSGSHIGPNSVIGHNVQIGRNTSVAANATVIHAIIGDHVIINNGARIGGDGFGFSMGPGGHLKIPQVGRVIIQDRVEVGMNSCIDRGANRDTIIGEGTKIDNLVQIGHNVEIGRHCVVVAQAGISGSTKLGNFVAMGGQSGVSGHLTIGDGAQVAGQSAVASDMEPGEKWGGLPARPIRQYMREQAWIRRSMEQEQSKKDNKDD